MDFLADFIPTYNHKEIVTAIQQLISEKKPNLYTQYGLNFSGGLVIELPKNQHHDLFTFRTTTIPYFDSRLLTEKNQINIQHHPDQKVGLYYHNEEYYNKQSIFTSCNAYSKTPFAIANIYSPTNQDKQLVIVEEQTPETLLKNTAEKIQQIINASSQSKYFIILPVLDDFVLDIAYTLTVRRILKEHFPSTEFKIIKEKNSCDTEADELGLIDNTIYYIASILGKADGYRFPLTLTEEQVYWSLNIPEILYQESFLHYPANHIQGAYNIEQLSTEIYSYIDKNIKNTRKKDLLNYPKQRPVIKTAERITVKNYYQKAPKLAHYPHLPGQAPFLRGPYQSMYLERPWTIRQYAGFSTAEESNNFYKKALAAGQKGLSVAFDLPTHRGYDSDHPRVIGDVGKAGVAIDTIEDMKRLFEGIPLDSISVSMTMNGAVLPILSFFIVAAEEMGYPQHLLSGTIQNDILKEFIVRNTYIYPPEHSMRIIQDIFAYCGEHIPKFNTISISGYHMHEAGATAELELAYTLANGIEYINTGLKAGLSIDDFAPRFSFFWGIGMNLPMEIAKMRAGRVLWARLLQAYLPKNEKSLILRTHCQTSGWSLIAQYPQNNIIRTTVEALAAIIGHTQSLHTNSLDEAVALPTEHSARIARNTQLFLMKKTGLCNHIDPFGGAYYIEQLTEQLIEKSWKLIEEIQEAGGMTTAIRLGIPKFNIEQAAARKQARIDSNTDKVIGLNHFEKGIYNHPPEIKEIDNEAVKKAQITQLTKIKAARDQHKVNESLNAIEEAARNNSNNLLALCINAAKARATLGEISSSLENVFGRHKATSGIVSGVYNKHMNDKQHIEEVLALTKHFRTLDGRSPRILIAKMGQDGHDRGAKVIAGSFADMGFDVDLGPLFQTPEEVAKQAIENDVHIVGISTQAGAHKTLVKKLSEVLIEMNADDVMIVVGGIIPIQDYEYLNNIGVKEIFGPGTVIPLAAKKIMESLIKAHSE